MALFGATALSAQAPQNSAAAMTVSRSGELTLVYNRANLASGEVGAPVRATTEVSRGERGALLEKIQLTAAAGKTVALKLDVHASDEAFAAETMGEAQRRFPLVRTASGEDHNLRNNAIYDRHADWMLEFPPGTVIEPRGPGEFRVTANGPSVLLRFAPRFYQLHRNLAYYEPWTYKVWPDPVAGWSSWWAYEDSINEDEVRQIATLFAAKLRDFGYQYIQLDAGYHPQDGYPAQWLKTNAKFPSGIGDLAALERSLGLKPAIWENVQIDDAKLAAAHPAWFLAEPGSAPTPAAWVGYGLDGSNSEAVDAVIRPTYRALHAMGYKYVKIDTLRHLLYDASYPRRAELAARGSSPEAAFRKVLSAAREELGPETYLLACWGVLPEVAGIADGDRLGTDGFGPATLQQYNSWNNVVWRNDPDHVDIGGAGEDVIRPVLVSMAGAQLMVSDAVGVYQNDAKLEGARRAAPVLFTLPGQLYDYDAHASDHLALGLRNQDGGANPGPIDAERLGDVCPWWLMDISRPFENWSVLARLSWSALPAQQVRFRDLGLASDTRYAVYEFWTRRLVGIFKGSFVAPAQAAKAARVYSIRAVVHHPQIVSTNRHISQGGVDLEDVRWSAAEHRLSGASDVVASDPYQIVLRVPAGYELTRAEFDGHAGKISRAGGIVTITTLPARTGRLTWSAEFR